MSDPVWPFVGTNPLNIARANGVHLITADGRRILDAAGGAIVSNVGHGRERVARAVYESTRSVGYVVPPWRTADRVRMVEELRAHWVPPQLTHIHVTSGGSEAVESAVKLALQYHHARGAAQRTQIITRAVSYHGTTLATANLSGHPRRKIGFAHTLHDNPKVDTAYPLRTPSARGNRSITQYYVDDFVARLEAIGPATVAALLAEPITGSSGGAIVPPDDYWPQIKAICERHGILLIFDEVMTGFGRTGTRFAFEHWNVLPDILVSGKGLAGGYAPLGAMFASPEVAITVHDAGLPTMFHTFGAHPAACAAATEVLRILREEDLVARAAAAGQTLRLLLEQAFEDHPHVAEVRGRGLLQAIEVVQDRATLQRFPVALELSTRIVGEALSNGVFFYGRWDRRRTRHCLPRPAVHCQTKSHGADGERAARGRGRRDCGFVVNCCPNRRSRQEDLMARNPQRPTKPSLSLVLGQLAALLLLATSASASLTQASQRVDNFVLLDHLGKGHELYYNGGAKAVVIMIQGNGCPIVRNALPAFKALRDEYQDKGVRFLMLNANLQDNRASIAREAAEWSIDVPILDDTTQLIGESLNLVRTGEVLVIEPKTWQVAYRGPLNDRLDYERQKAEAKHHYVRDAVNELLAGKPVSVSSADAIGCLINFPDRKTDHAQISYSKTVAPILEQKCAVCHRPGGIGPWAMTSYDMIRGFAPMIREVIRTKRMPPWHADPHTGSWKGDRSLTKAETQTLVRWIEAGAPRGDGPDPLAEVTAQSDDWPMGEPDLVLELPEFTVPASGVVDYQFPVVKTPLKKDVWVRAATVIPGDRSVVHHVLVGAADGPAEERRNTESVFDNYIIGYAPGNESSEMPEGHGVFIPAGGDFLFQMHYTPTGKETVDKTRLGLYFADAPPKNFFRHNVVLNPAINIPPHAAQHEEVAYFEFHEDAYLHALTPHAHYRGRSSSFELLHADGTTETLLSVPRYDFNWQRTYEFAEAKAVPAGARLIHRTIYDNSEFNPGNPDPERRVPWGLQSWDEMLYGAFSYSWAGETSDAPTHDKARAEYTQMVGFMDRDMDGKLAWQELPKRMKQRLVQGFKQVDANGDGGLDVEEFLRMHAQRQQAQAQRNESGGAAAGAR